jgi:hypothetical protein
VSKTDENVDWVKEFIITNKRITICEMADILEISFVSVQRPMKDKWSETWNSGDWFLHHDNTLLTVLSVPEFLANK